MPGGVSQVPDGAREALAEAICPAPDDSASAHAVCIQYADGYLAALSAAGYAVVKVGAESHVIEFRDDGWTISHPLECRPQLFDCQVNRAAGRQIDGPPATGLGFYDIELDEYDGLIRLMPRGDSP